MHFLQDDFGLAILRKVYHIYPASLKSIIPELRHRLASLRKTTQTTQYEMKRAVDSSRPNVRQPSRPKHQIFHLLNLLWQRLGVLPNWNKLYSYQLMLLFSC